MQSVRRTNLLHLHGFTAAEMDVWEARWQAELARPLTPAEEIRAMIDETIWRMPDPLLSWDDEPVGCDYCGLPTCRGCAGDAPPREPADEE